MNIIKRLLTPYIYLRDKYVDWRIKGLSEKDRFRLIYKTGYWNGTAIVSPTSGNVNIATMGL